MASSSSSSHHVPISSSRSCKYDVFLSFRGEDTRKTFVDHLCSALKKHLISVYKDDETLLRGESICPSLFEAIEDSRIAVIVISENYANSSWCLEELAYIVKCKNERGLIVLPIFYGVEPSEVRDLNKKFGQAFVKQEAKNINKAELWRKALFAVGNIAGWEPKHIANGHESKVIEEIVDSIFDRLFPLNSSVDENLIGITTRLQDLKSLLKIGSGGVRMVGIWGVGGGGKTTLASSLYMQISSDFDSHHFVENIREETNKFGLKKLQENILSTLFSKKVEVGSVMEGKCKMERMLCHKNVLIVLDDVSDGHQLDALVGSHKWFGSGSRIIITTRDEHLLRVHKVDEIYPVRLLSSDEAIQLFNRHAFNKLDCVEGYETLSLRAISYAAGLPLALKALGSFLCDKDENEWISTLNKLKDIPDPKVHDVLKISFDGLEHYQKELFLDIACFFRGELIDVAMEILEACDFHPKIGIKVLKQKALINVTYDRFDMHDLVQEMGHHIVRREHPKNLEKHSRVWKHEEIINMCHWDAPMIKVKENDKTEAIVFYDNYNLIQLSNFYKLISNMNKLRYLRVATKNTEHDGWPTFLSNELRCIDWDGYTTSSFSKSFQPMNLVVLKLSSSQKELWKGCKFLPHLKVLQLKFMDKLLNTPDFGGLPCLQKLTLSYCSELEEIHPSLGNHTSLEYIRIFDCPKFRMFPPIVNMEKLKTLEIEQCNEILEFPEIYANMKSLEKLSLKSVGIEVLPSTIGECCTNLISLCLEYCSNLQIIDFNFEALKYLKELKLNGLQPHQLHERTFHKFPRSLRKLDLRACRLKDGEIPYDICKFPNLEELNLSLNYFSRLDFSLSLLTQLKLLNLSGCDKLLELPELPSSLAILVADGCVKLATFGDPHKSCKRLFKVSLICGSIINDGCTLLLSMFERKAIQNNSMVLQLQGIDVAKGFIPCLRVGRRCGLQLPENWYDDYYGFLMSAVFWTYESCTISINMNHMMNDMDSQSNAVSEENESNMCGWTWVGYVSFVSLRDTTWWDHSYKAISFDVQTKYDICSAFGVGLVPLKSISRPTDTSTDFFSYTPLKIEGDSKSTLRISFM